MTYRNEDYHEAISEYQAAYFAANGRHVTMRRRGQWIDIEDNEVPTTVRLGALRRMAANLRLVAS